MPDDPNIPNKAKIAQDTMDMRSRSLRNPQPPPEVVWLGTPKSRQSRTMRLLSQCMRNLGFFFAGIGLFVIIASVVVTWKQLWRPHFFALLHLAWLYFLHSQGTTSLGFVSATILVPLFIIGLTVFLISRSRGREAMVSHWRKDAALAVRVTVIVVLIYYGPLFLWNGVKAVYDDHKALVNQNQQLVKDKTLLQKQNVDLASNRGLQTANDDAREARSDARRWREAYEGVTRGDLHPDRHLDREDRRKLREELELIAKNPSNKEYIKIDFGMSGQIEASQFGWQLFNVFKEAKWRLPTRPSNLPKDIEETLQAYGGANASGVFIFTDDPQNRGLFLAMLLKAHGIPAIVNLRGIPPHFTGVMIWVGTKQYQVYRDDD